MAGKDESLLLRLDLDASGFSKGSRGARKELGLMEKAAGSLKGQLSSLAAGAAAGIGLAVLVHEALDLAEAVTKVHDQTGLAVSSIQFLRLAADQTGTSVDSLASLVGKMQRQLVEASSNPKLAAQFKDIGLSVESLRAMRPEEQLQAIAVAIAGISDPAEKTTAAVLAFGKSGADAIPELTALAQQNDALVESFQRTGGAISDDTIAGVESLGDSMGEVKTAVVALSTELLGTCVPALNTFFETVTEIVGGLRLLDGQGDNAMVNLDNKITAAKDNLKQLEAAAYSSFGGMSQHTQDAIAQQKALIQTLQELYNAQNNLGVAGIAAAQAAKAAAVEKRAADLAEIASIQEVVVSEQVLRDGAAAHRLALETDTEAKLFAMREAARAQEFEAVQADRERENDFLAGLQTSTDEIMAAGAEEASNLKIQTWQQETSSIAQLLQQQTAGVANQNRAMFEINKAAGIANTVVNTAQAIMKVWGNPGYPMAIPLTVAVAAAGVAQLNAIKSAKFGGGGGLAPSQAATPPVPTAQAGGDGGGNRVMRVEGVSAGSLLTGSMVRTLAGEIGNFVRDGGKVEWAD